MTCPHCGAQLDWTADIDDDGNPVVEYHPCDCQEETDDDQSA